MKRTLLFALALGVTTLLSVDRASAEGYQVNTLSAKQLGMGHVGVSQKLDSESLWFNPAGASHQDGFFSISAGTTLIAATAKWSDGADSHSTDNKPSTPIYINANIKLGKNLGLGVLFNTPYGSSLNWGDDWAGAHMVQSISLQSYNFQPTVSYKLFNGRLAVGAGLMVSWGSFEQSKSVVSNEELTAVGVAVYGSNPIHMTLKGDSGMSYGYNIGVMLDLCKSITLGASYRSKMMMRVEEGSTEIRYMSESAETAFGPMLNAMTTTTFTAEMPLPAVWSLGLTIRPSEKLEIAAEAQMTEWSAYQYLDLTMNNALYSGYNQSTEKAYSNAFAARLGAQYKFGKFLTARAGFYYDQSPVGGCYLNPETPSMDKLGYTAGFSLTPFGKFSIDVAYGFLHGIGSRSGYSEFKYLSSSEVAPFNGTYKTHAHMASVGVSFGF